MKSSLSILAAGAAVCLLVLLPLLLGCETPVQPNPNGCERPKVVAFTASWCGPCQRAKSALVQIEASGVEVQVVDIDAHPELARQYGVTSVPTFFVYLRTKRPVRTQDIAVVASLFRCGR